jgi:hypothetical protein
MDIPWTVWIGGTDAAMEGIWAWVTGEPWQYTSWGYGEPNNSGGDENCVEDGRDGAWNDNTCDQAKPYMCEWDTYTAPPAVVEPPTSSGRYAELSARWWQWLLSIPAAVNPNLDATGANCAVGQYDDAWFLAGAFASGQYTRQCTIPAGKPIFLPLVNVIVFKPLGSETLVDLRQQAAAFIDGIDVLECTLDGAACFEDPAAFRVRSPTFTVMAPPKGIVPAGQLKAPGNTDPIVSDGYWLLIPPPYEGAHTIKLKAANSAGFNLEMEYDLTIE